MTTKSKTWPSPAALRALAFGLFALTLAITALTAIDYGIASDVGNYFYSSLRQIAWARDLGVALINGEPTTVLNQDRVFEHWRWYAERIPHPPLSRELSGVSWLLLRDLTDPLTAYRGAVMFTFAALTASVGVYAAWRTRSLAVGFAAGLAVPAFPVLFAHGHLAHTDLFLAAFWFWSVASLDYAVKEGGTGWFLSSGLFLGAATATKFSGLLLLPVLAIWLVANRSGVSAFLVLCLTGALVFVAVNPVMWVDPMQGVADYLHAGLDRASSDDTRIATEYFGEIFLFRPPWHYPYVWTLIVFPLSLLVAAVAGLIAPRSGPLRGLVLVNMAVLYGALALPSAPMHDGVRLFLPLFPFYCALAGSGSVVIGEWVTRALQVRFPSMAERRDLIVALAIVACLAPAAIRTAQIHPYQLSFFNAFVGGVEGAERRGLEVTNLKEVLNREVLEDLVEVLPERALLDPGFFIEEVCFYQAVGWVPAEWRVETQLTKPDGSDQVALACEGPASFTTMALDRTAGAADFVFVLNRKAQWRRTESALVGFGGAPMLEVSLEGVPLMMVYRTR
ncbi:MAG: glycosyltransferase family 39 protein [marine benthic group bacterium]|nr:glycosyltransferase family 39 protein [Gemmatimonadota bacterium]